MESGVLSIDRIGKFSRAFQMSKAQWYAYANNGSLARSRARRCICRPVKLREFETLQRFNGENMASIGVPSNGVGNMDQRLAARTLGARRKGGRTRKARGAREGEREKKKESELTRL